MPTRLRAKEIGGYDRDWENLFEETPSIDNGKALYSLAIALEQLPTDRIESVMLGFGMSGGSEQGTLAVELGKRGSTTAVLRIRPKAAGQLRRSPTESFVARADRLVKRGKINTALDILYDKVDEMLRRGRFTEIDRLIAAMDVDELSVDILLGLLTTTLSAKSELPSRPSFFSRVDKSISDRGEQEQGLLTGLE